MQANLTKSVSDRAENKAAAAMSPRRAWTVHREYEFAVEVTAGPPNSVFRHTKARACFLDAVILCSR